MTNEYKKVIAEKKAEAVQLMSSNQLTKCNIAIHTAAVASAAAGVIPVPIVDAVPITIVQVSMVIALGKIFDRKITESDAKSLIGAIAATFVSRNLVKLIPGFGWCVSAAVAGGITEAVGWTIAVDMANNAKKEWENDNCTVETTDLEAQAEQFISGQKNPEDYKEDIDKLCRDIQSVLDSLTPECRLRDYYFQLLLLRAKE